MNLPFLVYLVIAVAVVMVGFSLLGFAFSAIVVIIGLIASGIQATFRWLARKGSGA